MGSGTVTGGNNIGIGSAATCMMTSGYNNIGIGKNAQTKNTSGCRNIGIGDCAGCDVTTTKCVINIYP